MPTVSIIIPFFNGEKYLRECIENIRKQTYKDFEIVLIDDGSKDNSRDIIKNYTDCKIRYYYIDKDTEGVGKARNYGIQIAKGKYIMFVDVDDYIDENLLGNLQIYINQEIDLIKYKMKIVRPKNKTKCSPTMIEMVNNENRKDFSKETIQGPVFDIVNGEEAFNRLCFKDRFFDSPCLYLIKKDLFTRNKLYFKENMYHEDFGLIPILILKSETVASTEFYGYYYVQSKDSIMRNEDYQKSLKKVNDKFEYYKNMIDFLKLDDLSNVTAQNIKIYYTNSVILSLKTLRKKDRKNFERKIKDLNMIDNLRTNNIKQFVKKVVLNISIELYLSLCKLSN